MRRLLDRIGSALDPSIALLIDLVRAAAHPLTDAASDNDTLLELIDKARFVLIGEASHGTSSICDHLRWWRLGSAQGSWLPSAAWYLGDRRVYPMLPESPTPEGCPPYR
jgi:hypothetical protein